MHVPIYKIGCWQHHVEPTVRDWPKTLIHMEQYGLNCPNVLSYMKRSNDHMVWSMSWHLYISYLVYSMEVTCWIVVHRRVGMNLAWNPHGTILTLVFFHQDCFGHYTIRILHVLLDIHESYMEVEPQTQQIMWNTHMSIHKSIILKKQSEGHKRSIIIDLVAVKKERKKEIDAHYNVQTMNLFVLGGGHLTRYMLKWNKWIDLEIHKMTNSPNRHIAISVGHA